MTEMTVYENPRLREQGEKTKGGEAFSVQVLPIPLEGNGSSTVSIVFTYRITDKKTLSKMQEAGLDEAYLKKLYVEFADEDRQLANMGLDDYNRSLLAEDSES